MIDPTSQGHRRDDFTQAFGTCQPCPVGPYRTPARASRACASSCGARASVLWERLPSERVTAGPCSPLPIGSSRRALAGRLSSAAPTRQLEMPAAPASRPRAVSYCRRTLRYPPTSAPLQVLPLIPSGPENGQTRRCSTRVYYLNLGLNIRWAWVVVGPPLSNLG